jgi:hypothetical protein
VVAGLLPSSPSVVAPLRAALLDRSLGVEQLNQSKKSMTTGNKLMPHHSIELLTSHLQSTPSPPVERTLLPCIPTIQYTPTRNQYVPDSLLILHICEICASTVKRIPALLSRKSKTPASTRHASPIIGGQYLTKTAVRSLVSMLAITLGNVSSIATTPTTPPTSW